MPGVPAPWAARRWDNRLFVHGVFVLNGGQTHVCTQAFALLGDRKPEAVLADKVYGTDPILNHLD